jgi:hypothetical protein
MEDAPKIRDQRIIDSARQAIARSRDLLNKPSPRIAPEDTKLKTSVQAPMRTILLPRTYVRVI